jgi:hypothetical protein
LLTTCLDVNNHQIIVSNRRARPKTLSRDRGIFGIQEMTHRPFYAATTVRTGWCQESQVGLPALHYFNPERG